MASFLNFKKDQLTGSGRIRKIEILSRDFEAEFFELNIKYDPQETLFFCHFKNTTEKVELQNQMKMNSALLDDHIEELTSANEVLRKRNALIYQAQADAKSGLRYGKLIQSRINSSVTDLQSVFRDFFVYYKPQDEIGGDFVWCSNSKIGKIITVVDCMGHGVPGAMLSMSVFHFLNSVLVQGRFESATQFLVNLIRDYSVTFFNSNMNDGFMDTFDVSICVVDERSKLIRYRGVKHPLLIIRKGEFIEFKGDRVSIADPLAIEKINEEPWDKVYPYKSGDQVYLFSDGFPDQFGGAKNKKYKYQNFKKLLKRLSRSDCAEQKIMLDNELWDWQNTYSATYDQTDDITIVGIRL